MGKHNRSLEEFTNNINQDFIERRNEIKVMKDLVEKNKAEIEANIYAKYFIVCLYANWEGFIKYASECFISFVAHKNLKNEELNYGLLAISNLDKIKDFLESNIALKAKAIEELIKSLPQKAKIPSNFKIATYSNLNTETLEEICIVLGLDENKYSTKKGIIDEKLLRKRNEITHGTAIRISAEESIEIYDDVFPILEEFRNDVLNKASTFKNT